LVESNFTETGPWLEERMLYKSLSDTGAGIYVGDLVPNQVITYLANFIDTLTDTNILTIASDLYTQLIAGKPTYNGDDSSAMLDTAFANFYAAKENSDYNAIQAYSDQLNILSNDAKASDTVSFDNDWLSAVGLNASIPETNTQAVNFKTIQAIYLKTIARSDTFVMDTPTLAVVFGIADQCPYVAGDAVYYARALYAQYVDTLFFDDLILCTADSMSDRMLEINNHTDTANTQKPVNEFVKVFPNPARELINLAFGAQTAGTVQFELISQLGQAVITEQLGYGQTFAQFSTGGLSSGLYYWQLKDSERVIKTGKVVIIQ